jgi:hypothetical protein
MTTIEDLDGIVSGGRLPEEYIRKDLIAPEDLNIESELDLHIAELSALHPNLVQFRKRDLKNLDEATKRALLEDMCEALGINVLNDDNS